jgi:ABC-2 type transport system ATP-binding protein
MNMEIRDLTKKFADKVVLNHISISMESGKIYGFVGRNGSGKTMLMKHILGFIYPTSGAVYIDGKRIGKEMASPESVGAIIENPGFLPDYSGYKNLKLLSMVKGKIGKKEIKETLELVGLDADSKQHVKKYSLGMRQRLGLAQALMENPDLLLLDEPMNGLDNDGVREVRKILLEQKEQGKLIVIASHNNEDIEVLCDKIYYFDKGVVSTEKPIL